MNNDRRRILLVVDGSYQSFETVNYVSGVLPPAGSEVVLLHIMSKVPEAFWDLEKDPAWRQKVQTVRGWEKQQEKKIGDFMSRATHVFMDAGFPGDAVKTEVRERNEGIARDIGAESVRGYKAVILGRRGLSAVKDIALGGVAYKLVLKLANTSVWLVGGKPETNNILVGIDSSDGAMLAVDHVSKMIRGTSPRITLIHVIRSLDAGQEGYEPIFTEDYLKKRTEEAVQQVKPVIRKAIDDLTAAGIPPERISTRIVTGVSSRAGTILDEARRGDYGTIVVGRRGLSTVEEFDMGRVSNKLIQAAKDRAVWLVD